MSRPTYRDFVFHDAKIVARAWLSMNPIADTSDVELIFEKAMDMAYRLLVDENVPAETQHPKPLRQVLEEIGVDPADYMDPAPPAEPSYPPAGDYPFPAEAGRLHIDGTTFRTESGDLWQWRGFSWFLGFLRYCRGEDVTPDLRWLRANGFNIVRIFGPLPWVQTPDYRVENFSFDKLPGFFALLEAHGLRCNWSIAHYEHPELKAHVQRWYDIAADCWSPVAEAVNEPHIGSEKPDPIALLKGINRRGVLTSYGFYGSYYVNPTVWPIVFDFGTIHTQRDSAWDRKARHAQEVQHATGKPWISDEPAKITEPGFFYPGGKNDPAKTPAEAVWHAAIAAIYTPGSTVHTEEGKWGRVPTDDMLQSDVVRAVRDHVWLKIGPEWQTGRYMGAHLSSSPVDGKDLKIDGQDIWTYINLHEAKALAVRCAVSEPAAIHGWRRVASWGPGNSIVQLER